MMVLSAGLLRISSDLISLLKYQYIVLHFVAMLTNKSKFTYLKIRYFVDLLYNIYLIGITYMYPGEYICHT